MKNLRKIIALFALIFLTGIYISIEIIDSSLNKEQPAKETVEIQKDTLYLLEAEKKSV